MNHEWVSEYCTGYGADWDKCKICNLIKVDTEKNQLYYFVNQHLYKIIPSSNVYFITKYHTDDIYIDMPNCGDIIIKNILE
jgi:hypothetical protein